MLWLIVRRAAPSKVFDIAMTQIESIIEPDGIVDDFGQEPMTIVWIIWRAHPVIVAQQQLTWQYRHDEISVKKDWDAAFSLCRNITFGSANFRAQQYQ